MPRISLDSGPVTHLPICSCGWRGLPTTTRQTAWSQGAAHEAACHPCVNQAAAALYSWIRRPGEPVIG